MDWEIVKIRYMDFAAKLIKKDIPLQRKQRLLNCAQVFDMRASLFPK